MSERKAGAWVLPFVAGIVLAAAVLNVAFGIYLALSPDDTEPLESPLLLALARQLIHGPWELYGPFSGRNPYVIIHAPLYYHLSALGALPLMRAGVGLVTASLAAARGFSFLGLIATMAATYRLARLDGAARMAGWFAVALVAGSQVVGVMPYTVRPDMLGIALQTTGILLVLEVLYAGRAHRGKLVVAYTAFGLAACTKQHFLVGPFVSTLLLFVASSRGRLPLRQVTPALLVGMAIVILGYGGEELASGGHMSEAVFQAASSSQRVHPVNWVRASIVVFGIVGKSGGLVLILASIGLARVNNRPGIGRRAIVILGAIFLSLIAARTTLDLVELELTGYDGLIVVAALGMVVFVIIPTCFVLSFDRRSLTWLDITLAIYFCAEFILLVLLSRASAGAWFNYGIQGTVFASVVTARALARICANAVSPWVAPLFGLAALMVLVGVCENARETVNARNAERIVVAHIINHYQAPASVFFFVERPGLNRLHGLLNLVYDEWLYPVFEAVHLAQPRSIWLQSALTAGDIRFVVNKTESNKIDGLGKTLPQMGYRPGLKVGADYYVWQRLPFDADPASR